MSQFYNTREDVSLRVQILNVLAAYYLQLAGKEKDSSKREQYYGEATQAFNRADQIDHLVPWTWIGKGSVCFIAPSIL